ncbi:unnamed protein product [Dovyalis caffra]|uniref:Uncharacterized protein n=1 Tax=Dovyalis caffra TaxID=77055 RepID=A0AAV1QYB8_9ROSI|nr:unnamed protein product [Dovyalis caffra]
MVGGLRQQGRLKLKGAKDSNVDDQKPCSHVALREDNVEILHSKALWAEAAPSLRSVN